MTSTDDNFVIVLKTGKRYELEMATNALTEANIPYYMQEDTSSGVRLAMPISTAMGPGLWWTLFVPERLVSKAQEVLEQLPFEVKTNPDIWDFGPSEETKQGFKFYAWLMLIAVLVAFIKFLFDLFTK
ncbi:MAG TPA: hypothetical protein DCP92_20875 [Nitrospiraceae bacterium]|jgi:hypothetical protein|nr:hypothetical protein [Nitrospiraceae bacterium]